ncbi:MAG: acyl-CoA/acyl-ACP dehydrogenase [Rhodobacteraceae bacterium]|nr:acyl-CoA/acyl-ACP dehydrogenase [Paracoccaceae bacterium]
MLNVKTERTINFSDEQEQLLEIATNFCREKSEIAQVRSLLNDEKGFAPQIWLEMAELGWMGVAIPEEFGGSGLGLGEVVALVEPMGRALFTSPFITTTLAAQALLAGGTQSQQARWLPRICKGAVLSLALSELHGDWDLSNLTATALEKNGQLELSGTKTFVSYAPDAQALIVSVSLNGAPALVLVDAEALPEGALVRETNVDETQRTYRVVLDGLRVPSDALLNSGDIVPVLNQIHLAANLLSAAELSGGIGGVLEYTLDYLRTRKQFDRLIGSYQSLKHTMTDILLGYEATRSHLYYAAGCFGADAEGEIALRMAKAQASETLAYAADRAIQFHGGFGFTYDCDAQLYRRRAIWGASFHGDAPFHRQKLGDLLL